MLAFNQYSSRRGLLAAVAILCVALSASGCIRRQNTDSTGGGSTPGGGGSSPIPCANLPSTTSFKGGDALGEELTVSINPSALTYAIAFDATDQRTDSQVTGALTQLDACRFASEEAGAVFTAGPDGVLQGGVKTVAGTSFTPFLAFSSTYNNASTPTVFNDVALTFNAVGVQTVAGITSSYFGSGRIRNAGTMQFCAGLFSANTCSSEKGYFTYNSTRNAFDYFLLPSASAAFPSPPSGGTLAGSMVLGVVNGVDVMVFLRRASATDFGMRLLTPQVSLASGNADGSYLVVDSSGGNASATWALANFTRGTDTATLTFDSPVAGVVTAAGANLNGNLIYGSSIYGFVPSSGSGAAFEMGIQE